MAKKGNDMADSDLKLIQALRDKTGMGVAACKKALAEAGGDLEKAELALRKMGADKAAKKADRPTGQGVVAIKVDASGKRAAMVEVACEQEPTTQNARFLQFVDAVLEAALSHRPREAAEALRLQAGGKTLQEMLTDLIAVASENVVLRRVAVLDAPAGGTIGHYLHFNRKIGCLCAVRLEGIAASDERMRAAANDICMHAAAARPLALDRRSIPAKILETEKEVYREEVKNKPPNIQEKILEGKLAKFYQQSCLLEQIFVKDPDQKTTVQQFLAQAAAAAGGKAELMDFVRFELGMGA
ncbi:MAG: translation elongation factor Ts [Planctomycetota bacterium]|nr:translation elongation factor Ts [Planctomycetota bacterium]